MTVPPCRVFDLASYRSIAIPKSAQILPIGRSRVNRAAAKPTPASSDAEARDVDAWDWAPELMPPAGSDR
jgi:hypothetical protein